MIEKSTTLLNYCVLMIAVWRYWILACPGTKSGFVGSAHRDGSGLIRRKALAGFRALIMGIDSLLKRLQGIREFSEKEECLLRLALTRSRHEVELSDGTRIRKGDCICELHFWNEHFPAMPKHGPDLAWALMVKRRMTDSLRDLAAYSKTEPMLSQIRAFHADTTLGGCRDFGEFSTLAKRWGFELRAKSRGCCLRQRIAEFFKSTYTTALIWAFNPKNLNASSFWPARRDDMWISREALDSRYAASKSVHPLSRTQPEPPVRRTIPQSPPSSGHSRQAIPHRPYPPKIIWTLQVFTGLCYEPAAGDADDAYAKRKDEHKRE